MLKDAMIHQQIDTQKKIMNKALLQARIALGYGEVPIGAVIVDAQGVIVARAYNKIETAGCQTAHAEALAINKACKKIGDWRLNGYWLYVTLEPCLMCLGLIQLSRLEGVIFGATSPLFGSGLSVSTKQPSYAKNLKITGGINDEKSIMLLQAFFKQLRKKRKDDNEATR